MVLFVTTGSIALRRLSRLSRLVLLADARDDNFNGGRMKFGPETLCHKCLLGRDGGSFGLAQGILQRRSVIGLPYGVDADNPVARMSRHQHHLQPNS